MSKEVITIRQINEVYGKIICQPEIANEIRDHFSFYAPGYQYMPKFRQKLWNGKIYLFSPRNNLLYIGLLNHLKEFCLKNDYILLEENNIITNNFSKEEVNAYIDSLNISIPSIGGKMEIRDYQREEVFDIINNKRGLIISPTASGKSLVAYILVRFFLDKNLKGLIVVPTVSLVEQMYSDFLDYSKINGWNGIALIHKIYQGQEKETEMPLTISTWQSLYKLPQVYYEKFRFIIQDEAHLAIADSLTKIATQMINASYRIGMTGTLNGAKCHHLILEGLFGPIKKYVTTKQLMEDRHIADLKINCLVFKYPIETCKSTKGLTYQEEIEFLISNKARNRYIQNLLLTLPGNSLLLYYRVKDHGQVLFDMLKDNGKKKVYFVSGNTEVEEREYIRKIIESEKNSIIIASYGVFSLGINIKAINNLIFGSPYKSRIKVLQSIGRGLRKSNEKSMVSLYDLGDDLTYKRKVNTTFKHLKERLKLYIEEEFTYTVYNIELKKG